MRPRLFTLTTAYSLYRAAVTSEKMKSVSRACSGEAGRRMRAVLWAVARSAARRARLLLVELARPLRRAVPQLRRVGEASAGDHEAAAAIVELERAEARRHVEVAPLRGVRNVHWAACGPPAVGAEATCAVWACARARARVRMRACSSSRSENT